MARTGRTKPTTNYDGRSKPTTYFSKDREVRLFPTYLIWNKANPFSWLVRDKTNPESYIIVEKSEVTNWTPRTLPT